MFGRSRSTIAMLCLLSFATLGALAHADLIVDTGDASGSDGAWQALYQSQTLAGRFTLTQDYTITGIQGYLDAAGVVETVFITVYGDLGASPDSSNILFTDSFVAGTSGVPGAQWMGRQDLSFALNAGSYWVDLSTHTYNFLQAPDPVTSPLAQYAAGYPSYWLSYPLNIGFRVYGTPDGPDKCVVPEPATLSLCGLGLLGFASRAYRNRKRP